MAIIGVEDSTHVQHDISKHVRSALIKIVDASLGFAHLNHAFQKLSIRIGIRIYHEESWEWCRFPERDFR